MITTDESSDYILLEDLDLEVKNKIAEERENSNQTSAQPFIFVNIIVGGEAFKTLKETLERYPNTLLGSPLKEPFWDEERKAYVFTEHCRRSFENILYFYQSRGTLSQPRNVYSNTFMEEVDFFQVPRSSVRTLSSQSGNKRTLTRKTNVETWNYKYSTSPKKIAYPPSNVRYTQLYTSMFGGRTWTYKYFPQVIMACDLIATVAFVFCHIASTIKVDQKGHETKDSERTKIHHSIHVIPDTYVRGIEALCMVWIIIHYVAALMVAAERFKYIISFMPMVDAIIVIAVLLDNILNFKNDIDESFLGSLPLRAIGVLRLFNLARHSTLLYCLGLALRQSFSDLVHVLFVILFIIFLAAGFVYFIEGPKCGQYNNVTRECGYNVSDDDCRFHPECTNNQTDYTNVFISSYWAAVTITTVGYGDMVPKTVLGKIVGSILALIGLPLIAIPMPLIMTKFEKLYNSVKEHRNETVDTDTQADIVGDDFKFNDNTFNKAKENCTEANNKEDLQGEMQQLGSELWPNCKQTRLYSQRVEVRAACPSTEMVEDIVTGSQCPPSASTKHQMAMEEIVESLQERDLDTENGRSWADSWREVYGRCPTGQCNDYKCDKCINEQTIGQFM